MISLVQPSDQIKPLTNLTKTASDIYFFIMKGSLGGFFVLSPGCLNQGARTILKKTIQTKRHRDGITFEVVSKFPSHHPPPVPCLPHH